MFVERTKAQRKADREAVALVREISQPVCDELGLILQEVSAQINVQTGVLIEVVIAKENGVVSELEADRFLNGINPFLDIHKSVLSGYSFALCT